MSVYQRLLGLPFVFERVRPLVVGGVDMSPGYANLAAGPDDVVLDVGCGTGDALNYLPRFRDYHGFDVDEIAIAAAKKRASEKGVQARFEARLLDAKDLAQIQPTRVMLSGLLHHIDDAGCVALLEMLARTPSVRRIATIDIVYLPGEHVSNLLARLDRGKHCRDVDGYLRLCERAGLSVVTRSVVRSHPTSGRAKYLLLGLEPVRA